MASFPELERILCRVNTGTATPALFAESEIRRETILVSMRDGIRLATDLYLPPTVPAPAAAMRTPYGRANERSMPTILALAQRGYVVISQDCRGTGDSEPDIWDYYIYEPEDGIDFVNWVRQQTWFNGFLCSFGASYVAATQWCMAAHPHMSAIVPEVCGLQTTRSTVRRHMLVNGYPRAVGKSGSRLPVSYTDIERLILDETLASGFFNEPLRTEVPDAVLDRYPILRTMKSCDGKRWLWERYCSLPPVQRADLIKQLMGTSEFTYVHMCSLSTIFDCQTTYGAHAIPSSNAGELCQRFHAPALVVTGWYDWNLADVLSSWENLRRNARPEVSSRSRLVIAPSAHNMPGYHEGEYEHPELRHNHRSNIDLMMHWYKAVGEGATDAWPTVIYYLMGANRWCVALDWPIPEAEQAILYLGTAGRLRAMPPRQAEAPDRYVYDPLDPTPTIGGSIISYVYRPGSVDVSLAQKRADVVTYTTEPLEGDLDIVGPVRLFLYASSDAMDTDFSARLSDVFPDGRAIQLQSGMLRARYRNPNGDPELLVPGRIYCFEISMWATANRFQAGHCLRLDISSADFPRFDRNSNRGGEVGPPRTATQTIYHDDAHPSHLVLAALGSCTTLR